MIPHGPELVLRAGDPVNLGERRHLIVKLGDVAAHNVEINAFFHHGVMDVVVLLEEPRRRDDGGPAIDALPACLGWVSTHSTLWIDSIIVLIAEIIRNIGLSSGIKPFRKAFNFSSGLQSLSSQNGWLRLPAEHAPTRDSS